MRETMRASGAVVLLVGGVGVLALQGGSDDALRQVGVGADSARSYVFNSITSGYLSYPGSKALKQIPPELRAGIVKGLGEFARTYLESAAFAEQYREFRESRRPEPPESPTTADQDRQRYKEELVKGIRQAEESLKSMPAEYREAMEQAIALMREQLKAADDPDNPMFSSEMDQYKVQAAEAARREHQERLAQWEREYPADPKAMIRLRLEQFLRESEGVDYAAKLKTAASGKLIFENPEYERKPAHWKLCYRVGRETVEAAREFGRHWLEDLKAAR
jgi:hypothetical protein